MCSPEKVHYRSDTMKTGVACNQLSCLTRVVGDHWVSCMCEYRSYLYSPDFSSVTCWRCIRSQVFGIDLDRARDEKRLNAWRDHFGELVSQVGAL